MLALRDRVGPADVGCEERDEGLDLDYVPDGARPLEPPTAGRCAPCRTRSASAATTPSCAWRPHELALIHDAAERAAAAPTRSGSRLLCDDGSLRLLRSGVLSRRMGDRRRAGDGVLGGPGRVDGRPVPATRRTSRFAGRLAGRRPRRLDRARAASWPAAPARRSWASSSPAARACRRASPRSAGYGRIFRAQVALSGASRRSRSICGASAGGGSYSPALADFVVMTRRRERCS